MFSEHHSTRQTNLQVLNADLCRSSTWRTSGLFSKPRICWAEPSKLHRQVPKERPIQLLDKVDTGQWQYWKACSRQHGKTCRKTQFCQRRSTWNWSIDPTRSCSTGVEATEEAYRRGQLGWRPELKQTCKYGSSGGQTFESCFVHVEVEIEIQDSGGERKDQH